MASRSAIGIVDNGNIHAVYCHWDGYPLHNGKILMQHYADPKLAMKLIKLGDISSLGRVIGKKHPFDEMSITGPKYKSKKALLAKAQAEGWTTYYGRDRGEEDVGFKTFANANDFINHYDGEYFYLLDSDGVWKVYSFVIEGWTKVEDYLKEAE